MKMHQKRIVRERQRRNGKLPVRKYISMPGIQPTFEQHAKRLYAEMRAGRPGASDELVEHLLPLGPQCVDAILKGQKRDVWLSVVKDDGATEHEECEKIWADDMLAAAWLKLVELVNDLANTNAVIEGDDPRGWLYTSMRRAAYDVLRRRNQVRIPASTKLKLGGDIPQPKCFSLRPEEASDASYDPCRHRRLRYAPADTDDEQFADTELAPPQRLNDQATESPMACKEAVRRLLGNLSPTTRFELMGEVFAACATDQEREFVKKCADGMDVREAARSIGISLATAYLWRDRVRTRFYGRRNEYSWYNLPLLLAEHALGRGDATVPTKHALGHGVLAEVTQPYNSLAVSLQRKRKFHGSILINDLVRRLGILDEELGAVEAPDHRLLPLDLRVGEELLFGSLFSND